MSLTRDEWVMMWNEIKRLEYEVTLMPNSRRKTFMMERIFYIKAQIQSVIGQME